jgi:hypothetical protein
VSARAAIRASILPDIRSLSALGGQFSDHREFVELKV